ncbi:MAG: hypothetical protein H6728_13970 [Myxococcales bacterium]|nr:hypothetical protein [Myxococcales bacterium]
MSLVWRQANRSISLMGILALGFDDLHGPTTHTFGSLRYRRSVCVVYEGHTNRKKNTQKKKQKHTLQKGNKKQTDFQKEILTRKDTQKDTSKQKHTFHNKEAQKKEAIIHIQHHHS